jgi:hypothetical protein
MSVVRSAWVHRVLTDCEGLDSGGLVATASFVVLVAIIALAAVSAAIAILYAL